MLYFVTNGSIESTTKGGESMKGIISAIVLFIVTCATALLMWVNWDNIVDHFDKLINPETQTEQVDDEAQDNDSATTTDDGMTIIELDFEE